MRFSMSRTVTPGTWRKEPRELAGGKREPPKGLCVQCANKQKTRIADCGTASLNFARILNSKSKRRMKNDLQTRTKRFALFIIELVGKLPRSRASDVIGHQLLKSGTSIGANYREATRAQSRDDFIHKIGICERKPPKQNTGSNSLKART